MSWNNFSFRDPNEVNALSILNQIQTFPEDEPISAIPKEVLTENGNRINTVFYESVPSQTSSSLGHTIRPLSEEEKKANQATMAQIKYDISQSFRNGLIAANMFKMAFRHHFESGKPITKRIFMDFLNKYQLTEQLSDLPIEGH